MNKVNTFAKNSRSKDPNERNKSPKLNRIPKTISHKDSKELKTTVSSNLNKSKDNNINLELNLNKTDSVQIKNDGGVFQTINNLNQIKPDFSTINENNHKITGFSFINNDTELKILDLKKELNHRGLMIFEAILNVIELSKLDPILDVFKTNSITHQYFINRILELITESLNNEREKTLESILFENKSLTKKISDLEENILKISRENEEKMKYYVNKLKQTEEIFHEKDEFAKKIENFLKEKENKINELLEKNEIILIEKEKQETLLNNIENDKESLRQKLNLLENNPKYMNLENECKMLKGELTNKGNLISSLQNRINEMNISHEELIAKINSFYEDNSNLKEELQKKNYLVEELIGKIETLRLEFDNKFEEKKNEIEQLTKINHSLNESINNTYKQKINALKLKLREKVNALSILEKQFEEYKSEKERVLLRYMQSNQKIINDKNQIINDLIRNKND